ncbi:N(G),N(G)-dimethylarginine dimethylaminohydrolase [Sphingomonas sp.]|uniref:dimethylarginine dimethylaminohydrolase family protein n=1 Tax=Sphingomonas sp. TaxID=28214 RepID=UPI00286DF045|nr:N(G),N(G)-dimethylarginine dimethylaminohydrolase [Sphingomonas sp.]
MSRAFTRAVSPRLAECALTHLARTPIDPERAVAQHAAYEAALRDAGLTVTRLPELPGQPDGVFVEDTSVVIGDHVLVTRPGADSRLAEADSTAEGLAPHLTVHRMAEGRLDGGDVLRIGRVLYVGLSSRTDAAGADALEAFAVPLGHSVVRVEPAQCLHLKTAVTFAGTDGAGNPTLLVNPAWVDPTLFADVAPLAVDEPAAANCLRVGEHLILPAGNPRAAEQLDKRGFKLVELDVSELQKAEAGVTCMSLIVED